MKWLKSKLFSPMGLSWKCKRKMKGSDSSLLWWENILCNLYSFSTFLDSKIDLLSTRQNGMEWCVSKRSLHKKQVFTLAVGGEHVSVTKRILKNIPGSSFRLSCQLNCTSSKCHPHHHNRPRRHGL